MPEPERKNLLDCWATLSRKIIPFPDEVYVIYSYDCPIYNQILKSVKGVTVVKRTPENISEKKFTSKIWPSPTVIDRQMQNINNDVLSIFTRETHHLNSSVILTLQNLFLPNPVMRTISLNARYLELWKQPRDIRQVQYLGQQMFPQEVESFVAVYKMATGRLYGYFLIEL